MIKGKIHYDEKYVKVKKDFCFDLNAIDSETKFVRQHKFTDERNKKNCIEFLSEIKENCYGQVLERYFSDDKIIFVCDGFENYKNAFNKLFYRVARLQFGVPIACRKFGLEHNNNPIERYNGKIKDRLKIMRENSEFFRREKHF